MTTFKHSASVFLSILLTAGIAVADNDFSRQDKRQLNKAVSGNAISSALANDLSSLFNHKPRSVARGNTDAIQSQFIQAAAGQQNINTAQRVATQSATAVIQQRQQAATVNANTIRITSIPFTISQPGAYLLADDMDNSVADADGITITSSQVTLDLGGFVLSAGTTAGDDGIVVVGDQIGIYILNGVVDGWGGDGINASSCDGCLFERLRVSNNTQNGLLTGFTAVVDHVIASFNGQDGIDVDDNSVVTFSNARENGGNGIQGSVSVVVAQSGSFVNGVNGIDVASGSSITNCETRDNVGIGYEMGSASVALQSTARDNSENGFEVFFASILRDNFALRNGNGNTNVSDNNGFRVSANSYAINNHALDNDGAGIRVISGDSVIENNVVLGNDRVGIEAIAGGNFILRNRASGNLTSSAPLNYDFAANNAFGPIVDARGISDISTIANSDNIYANLEY